MVYLLRGDSEGCKRRAQVVVMTHHLLKENPSARLELALLSALTLVILSDDDNVAFAQVALADGGDPAVSHPHLDKVGSS